MKDINEYMNYGFETFDSEGNLKNRISGPGHCGDWLIDIFSSPYEMAIIPAAFDEVAEIAGEERCLRTEMFPVDAGGKEIPRKRILTTNLPAGRQGTLSSHEGHEGEEGMFCCGIDPLPR